VTELSELQSELAVKELLSTWRKTWTSSWCV